MWGWWVAEVISCDTTRARASSSESHQGSWKNCKYRAPHAVADFAKSFLLLTPSRRTSATSLDTKSRETLWPYPDFNRLWFLNSTLSGLGLLSWFGRHCSYCNRLFKTAMSVSHPQTFRCSGCGEPPRVCIFYQPFPLPTPYPRGCDVCPQGPDDGQRFPSFPGSLPNCIWSIAQEEAVAGEMASRVKDLFCKHEDLSLIPGIYVKTNRTDGAILLS